MLLFSWRHTPRYYLDNYLSSLTNLPSPAKHADAADREPTPEEVALSAARLLQQSYVTHACWSEEDHVLYTGDFAGQLTAWELGLPLARTHHEIGSGVASAVCGDKAATAKPKPLTIEAQLARRPMTVRAHDGTMVVPLLSAHGLDLLRARWSLSSHGDQITSVQVCG